MRLTKEQARDEMVRLFRDGCEEPKTDIFKANALRMQQELDKARANDPEEADAIMRKLRIGPYRPL